MPKIIDDLGLTQENLIQGKIIDDLGLTQENLIQGKIIDDLGLTTTRPATQPVIDDLGLTNLNNIGTEKQKVVTNISNFLQNNVNEKQKTTPETSGIIDEIITTGKREAKIVKENIINVGPTEFFDFLDTISTFISRKTGLEKGGLFKNIADLSRIEKGKLTLPQNLAEKVLANVSKALTGDLPIAAIAVEAGGPIAGFAGLETVRATIADKPALEVAMEAIKGGLTGFAFGAADILAPIPKAAALGVLGAGTTLIEGSTTEEAITSGATLAILGSIGPSGTKTSKDVIIDFNKSLSKQIKPGLKPRSQILSELSGGLTVPIRLGKFRQKAEGIFKVKPEIIRLKSAGDIPVASHEAGHFIEKHLFESKNGKAFKQFKNELKPLATPGHPIAEGFAEFNRLYVTDPIKAQKKAPQFFNFYDNELRVKHPETRQILLRTRQDFNNFKDAPSAEKVRSHIVRFRPEQKTSVRSLAEKFYTDIFDKFAPIERLTKKLTQGKPISAADDPAILARVFAGHTRKADWFVRNGPSDFSTFKKVGPGLQEITKPVAGRWEDFWDYAAANRIINDVKNKFGETNIEQATGLPFSDWKNTFDKYDSPEFKKTLEDVIKFNDQTLNYLLDSYGFDAAAKKTITEKNPNFVPLHRLMNDPGEMFDEVSGNSSTFGNQRNPIKGFSGKSQREIIDPAESIIKNVFTMTNLAERNAVASALVNLVEKIDGGGRITGIEKLPAPMKSISLRDVEIEDIINRFAKLTSKTDIKRTKQTDTKETIIQGGKEQSSPSRKLEQVVKDALQTRGFSPAEADGFVKKLKSSTTKGDIEKIIDNVSVEKEIITISQELGVSLPKETVNLFRPTTQVPAGSNIITVWRGGKREFWKLPKDIFDSMQGLDRETTTLAGKLLAIPANTLRVGATTTPAFIARNFVKDQFTVAINTDLGLKTPYFSAKGIFDVINSSEMYDSWIRGGGSQSTIVTLSQQEIVKRTKELVENPATTSQIIRHPWQAMKLLSQIGEEATRLGVARSEFEKSKNLSKSDIISGAFESREASLDFLRNGAKTQFFRNTQAFWNVHLQGLDKIKRVAEKDPVGYAIKMAVGITLPSLILTAAQLDDARLKQIPQWQKDISWIYLSGKHVNDEQWSKLTPKQKLDIYQQTVYQIPKSFESVIVFASIPERILEWAAGQNPDIGKSLLQTVGQAGLQSIVPFPTGAVPVLENLTNYSFFTKRPVIPRGLEDIEPQYQVKPFTSQVSKAIGKVTNTSPIKIDNLIRGYTGGLGILGVKAIDELVRRTGIVDMPELPARSLADIPGIRGFVVRFPSSNAESIQTVFEKYNESKTAIKTYKSIIQNDDKQEAINYFKQHENEIVNSKTLLLTTKALGQYQKAIRGFLKEETLTPEQKKDAINATYIMMIDFSQQIIDDLYSPKPKP